MSSKIDFDQSIDFRNVSAKLPDKPVSLPYELRTEMTWLDFCNPVNPLGVPKAFLQTLHTSLVDNEILYAPDTDGHEFRNTLARYLDISPKAILLGSSPSILMNAAAQAYAKAKVGIMTPCPATYITAVTNAGHDYVTLKNPISFAPVDPFSAQSRQGSFNAAILSNPGFPSSRLLPHQMLAQYLETCRWVIVDESYIELSFGGESVLPLLKSHSNLVVIRNLSTTFGMPGVPISYLIGHPETINSIRQFYDGSDVSMCAEVLAKSFILQDDFLDRTHDYLDKEIPWMQCSLSLIPGIRIFPAEGNYVLCEFDPYNGMRLGITCAQELIIRLQLAGLLVCNLSGVPGLDGDNYFCICVRSREDNERLLDTMRHIVSSC